MSTDVRVPFLDLTRHYKNIKSDVLTAFEEILEKQALVMGKSVHGFEESIADWIGVKRAICVASGTDALILGMKAMGVGAGDEVITPAYSFFASTSSILLSGAKPVFVDIDPDTFNLNVNDVERAITDKTKAIMPVHLYGQCANMKDIMALAKSRNLHVIEDYAQSIGAECELGQAGTIGDINATSFYPTKNLGGAGDGGMITTNSDEMAQHAHLLRIHGERERYYHEILGTNSRLDAFQGAYLSIKLPHLKTYMTKRQENASRYISELKDLEQYGLVLPVTAAGNNHVWNQFVIRIQNRDEVKQKLQDRGVQTAIYYPLPITDQKIIQEHRSGGSWPESTKACKEVLALPIYPELTSEEQGIVIEELRNILTH